MKRTSYCSRPSCNRLAAATLTYVYDDCTAVLGPLATHAEPHCYDLCEVHSERLTAPVGWEVVRIEPDPDELGPSADDIAALADAVREAARGHEVDLTTMRQREQATTVEVARKGHLRVLRSIDD